LNYSLSSCYLYILQPLPPPKKDTKWEKFAKEKGIPLNKEKRSRKVWDAASGTWMFRHGYQKANDDSKEWPIMEVKDSEDPFEDPWDRVRESKNARVDKNREQRMKNEERAGGLAKGTTNRLMKSVVHRRNAGKIGGILDRNDIPPTGLPIELGNSNDKEKLGSGVKRGKESTVKALLATQRSTASLGKFDKMREGEPERKKADNKALRKRKAVGSSNDPTSMSSEKDRSLKLLKVLGEGGAEKEKDRKKGRLATGETAYDNDFDDGLGPSSFRKKKGRAGAGKLKKMTKKRVK
jgi:regulator of ribosome biosynthesis